MVSGMGHQKHGLQKQKQRTRQSGKARAKVCVSLRHLLRGQHSEQMKSFTSTPPKFFYFFKWAKDFNRHFCKAYEKMLIISQKCKSKPHGVLTPVRMTTVREEPWHPVARTLCSSHGAGFSLGGRTTIPHAPWCGQKKKTNAGEPGEMDGLLRTACGMV